MRRRPRQRQRNQRVTYLPACLWHCLFNSLRPKRNRRHFADDIFKCIFLNENVLLAIKISLEFIPKGPIKSISALGQIMAWRRPGDKPLSEPICCVVYSRIHASLGLNELMAVMRYVRCVTWFEWTWIYRNCRRFTIVFTDVLVPFGARPFTTIIMALPGRCALPTKVVCCTDL